ncbi:MAG: type II toxin-antitoxin system VapC family toxin [Actinobacteria bacterium]|nr:type II toxin-antitoxin system VapC family toxin [Actinomycetota bacterium]
MSARFLLDTNIVVFALRRGPGPLRERLRAESDRLAVSTITVSELAYGAEKSQDPPAGRRSVDEFLSFLQVLSFDGAAARHAGEIRAVLARAGTPIGGLDVLIAGHARSAGLTVVTNNVREFARVPGLEVVDWSQ